MSQHDPLGYYALLELLPTATVEEIKAAFRRLAQQSHPDRNSSPWATARFQKLNEAYQVLGDVASRKAYDADFAPSSAPSEPPDATAVVEHEPVKCQDCGEVTAQPRYALFPSVLSAILFTQRSSTQGVFCSKCGTSRAHKAAMKTWLAGWWGFPWGPVYSLDALAKNMLGGVHPPEANAKLLTYQAAWFANAGRIDLAKAVAADALRFARKVPLPRRATESARDEVFGAINDLVARLGGEGALTSFKPQWGMGTRSFYYQASVLLAVTGLLVGWITIENLPKADVWNFHPTPGLSDAPASPPVAPIVRAPAFEQPILPLPQTGVIRFMAPVRRGTQLAPLEVRTRSGGPNYYIKVVEAATGVPKVVFFVRSGETAELKVPLGTYVIKEASGATWYGENWLFGPQTQYSRPGDTFTFGIEGDRVAGFTIELIQRENGNLAETALTADQF